MRAFERANSAQLVGPRILEEHIFERNRIAIRTKKTATLHPAECRLAQGNPFRIKMAVLGFVTDDKYCVPLVTASAEERIDTLEQHRLVECLAVNEPLQSLPRKLAFGQ